MDQQHALLAPPGGQRLRLSGDAFDPQLISILQSHVAPSTSAVAGRIPSPGSVAPRSMLVNPAVSRASAAGRIPSPGGTILGAFLDDSHSGTTSSSSSTGVNSAAAQGGGVYSSGRSQGANLSSFGAGDQISPISHVAPSHAGTTAPSPVGVVVPDRVSPLTGQLLPPAFAGATSSMGMGTTIKTARNNAILASSSRSVSCSGGSGAASSVASTTLGRGCVGASGGAIIVKPSGSSTLRGTGTMGGGGGGPAQDQTDSPAQLRPSASTLRLVSDQTGMDAELIARIVQLTQTRLLVKVDQMQRQMNKALLEAKNYRDMAHSLKGNIRVFCRLRPNGRDGNGQQSAVKVVSGTQLEVAVTGMGGRVVRSKIFAHSGRSTSLRLTFPPQHDEDLLPV